MWEGKEKGGENNRSIPNRNRMWAARGPTESVHTPILGTLRSSWSGKGNRVSGDELEGYK